MLSRDAQREGRWWCPLCRRRCGDAWLGWLVVVAFVVCMFSLFQTVFLGASR